MATDTIPIWQEPARGEYPDLRIFELGPRGIDEAISRGKFAKPPMVYLVGTWSEGADDQHTHWRQPITPWMLSSQGVVPGGFLAVVADMASGSITSRETRRMFSTSEMSFNFMRPATVASGPLKAAGTFIGLSGRLALSSAAITDVNGNEVCHMTARNVAADTPAATGGVDDPAAIESMLDSLPTWEEPRYETPDPYLREPAGEVLDRSFWEQRSGLDVLRGQISGDIPMPPIHHLLGIRPTAAGDGTAEFAMPATKWLTSGFQTVLGGFSALLGYSALASAIQTTTEPGMAHVPVDLKINFLRPVFADPDLRELTAKGHVVHRGRSEIVVMVVGGSGAVWRRLPAFR